MIDLSSIKEQLTYQIDELMTNLDTLVKKIDPKKVEEMRKKAYEISRSKDKDEAIKFLKDEGLDEKKLKEFQNIANDLNNISNKF